MKRSGQRPHETPRTETARCVIAIAIAATVAACAAKPEAARAPEAAPPSPSTPAAGYPAQPQQAQPYPSPPPPPGGMMPGQPGVADTPETRATRDFDTAERELSVAAGDCSNACRALGSMDRAAGNICKLSPDKPRCDDASAKVRTARDKVKNSCGDCKETSTNRNDPVPSR